MKETLLFFLISAVFAVLGYKKFNNSRKKQLLTAIPLIYLLLTWILIFIGLVPSWWFDVYAVFSLGSLFVALVVLSQKNK